MLAVAGGIVLGVVALAVLSMVVSFVHHVIGWDTVFVLGLGGLALAGVFFLARSSPPNPAQSVPAGPPGPEAGFTHKCLPDGSHVYVSYDKHGRIIGSPKKAAWKFQSCRDPNFVVLNGRVVDLT